MNWYLLAFKRIFDYKGRARRAEYGWFTLINWLVSFALSITERLIAAVADMTNSYELFLVSSAVVMINLIYSLAGTMVGVSLNTRRLHDLGYSGWWQLIFVVPIIGIVIVLLLNNNVADISLGVFFTALLVLFTLALVLVGVLIFKRGQLGDNKYGADPKITPENRPVETENKTFLDV